MSPDPVSNVDAAETAVVTGASGYVATELIKQLLSKGYNVRGTVRSLASKDKVSHLLKLNEALPGNLTLYEADLLKAGSFDEATKGAHLVFHTASPFQVSNNITDPMAELVEPAVEGTKNVLSSVAKHKDTVRKVLLTSSFAAVVKSKSGPSNGRVYTEEDWNTDSSPETCTNAQQTYVYSKVAAERVAWEICVQQGIKLITIQPVFVVGPVTSARTDATSVTVIKTILEGGPADSLRPWLCDVRDIGRAHVLAGELEAAHGRYIVAQSHTVSAKEVTQLLSQRFPEFDIRQGADAPKNEVIDNSKVQRELGMAITPWQESVIDMAVTVIQQGVAKPVLKQ
eukprot:jgi/Chrzof1/4149/Cz14g00270.t1